MLHVHLYGKLRRFAADADPRSESIVDVSYCPADTVGSVVARLGVPVEELGTNLFVDGRYADLSSPVEDEARLGFFPDDMQLLYKWYFRPKGLGPKGLGPKGLSPEEPSPKGTEG